MEDQTLAVRLLEVAPIVRQDTERQRQHLASLKEAGITPPRLVGVTTNGDFAAIRSYIRRIHMQARAIDPEHHNRTPDEALFNAQYLGSEQEVGTALEKVSHQHGVGILPFRPLYNEAEAARLRLLEAIPPQQDVDAQHSAHYHRAATALASIGIADHGLRQLGGNGIRNNNLRIAVVGDGPAVGRPMRNILTDMGHEPLTITHNSNQDWMGRLGEFDVVFGAAGSRKATEIITPDNVRRLGSHLHDRPPLIVVDAAYDIGHDGTPQGNLHRVFTDEQYTPDPDIDCLVTRLGAVGAKTGVQIFDNTFEVPTMQMDAEYDLALR